MDINNFMENIDNYIKDDTIVYTKKNANDYIEMNIVDYIRNIINDYIKSNIFDYIKNNKNDTNKIKGETRGYNYYIIFDGKCKILVMMKNDFYYVVFEDKSKIIVEMKEDFYSVTFEDKSKIIVKREEKEEGKENELEDFYSVIFEDFKVDITEELKNIFVNYNEKHNKNDNEMPIGRLHIKKCEVKKRLNDVIRSFKNILRLRLESVSLKDGDFDEWEFIGLKTLLLNFMSITQVPDFIQYSTKLQVLSLSHTATGNFEFYKSKGAKELEESGKSKKIEKLEELTELKELFINHTKIDEINIENLTKLKKFSLSATGISELKFPKSSKLKELYIDQSKITNLDFVQDLTTLERLDISNTDIAILPDKFNSKKNLTHLDISETKITKLPAWLDDAINLKFLNLTNLTLESFSQKLFNNLYNNLNNKNNSENKNNSNFDNHYFCDDRLRPDDKEISDDKKKKGIKEKIGVFLPRAKIRDMDVRYFTMKNYKIICDEYYNNVDNSIENKTVQILVCGDTNNIDKTIISDLFSITEEEYNNFSNLGVRCSNNLTIEDSIGRPLFDKDCNITFLELDNNHIYKAAHSFFMGEDSLYLVLLDSRNIESLSRLASRWVRHIKLYAPRSEIIFLLHHINHEDECNFFMQTKMMSNIKTSIHCIGVKNYYSDVEEQYETIDKLKNKLKDVIDNLPIYNHKLPINWYNAQKHFYDMMDTYEIIDYDKFKQIYHNQGIDDEMIRTHLELFRKSGRCFVSYDDNSEPISVSSPIRVMIGTYKAFELASSGNGVDMEKLNKIGKEPTNNLNGLLMKNVLLDELWDIETPAGVPFTEKDVDLILNRLKHFKVCKEFNYEVTSKEYYYENTSNEYYFFPMYLNIPLIPEKPKETDKKQETQKEIETRENLENFYKWIKDDPVSRDEDCTLHYMVEFEFISNTIFNQIILEIHELFENKDTSNNFIPLPKEECENEPFKTWFPINSDGAFFTLKKKGLDGKFRIYIGRVSRGCLHIYVHYENTSDNSNFDRKYLLEGMSVVMTAIRNTYKKFSGYNPYSSYKYMVDVIIDHRRNFFALENINSLVEDGVSENHYIASFRRNINSEDLKKQYYANENE